MAWFDNLLNHFAHYPTHLFALLFVLALSKSTVLILLRAAARLGDVADRDHRQPRACIRR